MNIYIPQHLKKIGIFSDMCKMIEAYAQNYEDPTSSFDSYQSYMKIDPVMRFIGYCIKEVREDQDYQVVLEYLTRMFYSVRGTRKVFDYMRRFLGINFIGEPVYTIKSISFTLDSSLVGEDISLFNRYLTEFLNYLLYYESLSYRIDGLGLEIKDNLEFYGGIGVITFKIYKDVEIDE